MTRATLLHVLEHPTALGPDEVRELEQLAQAFPYCQTAHLLLAKAAHDQGTMLAGQRLRRAATYAADRTLLRRLIEEVKPQPEATSPLAAPHPLDLVDWPDEYVAPVVAIEPTAAAAPTAPPVTRLLPTTHQELAATPPEAVAAPVVVAPTAPIVLPTAPPLALEAETISIAETAPQVTITVESTPTDSTEPIVANNSATDAPVAAETPGPLAAEMIVAPAPVAITTDTPAAPAVEFPGVAEPGLEQQGGAPAALAPVASAPVDLAAPTVVAEAPALSLAPFETLAPATMLPEVLTEAELPAQAPAIRPPAEIGEARFEYGLAAAVPEPVAPTYELPGLIDEWASAAVTLSLAGPEMRAQAHAPAALVFPAFTPAAFTGDAVVGYAFGESSRLGLALQLLDLLTAKAESAESTTAVVAAAQPAASALPPTGTFFEPDPLLLDHWATHQPEAPQYPSTVDLINNFLRRQPRLTRPAMLPPAATHQADLSVRSTRAEPDLVSENLARIFVRQGKTARAIEIYEKLMVKQPEKMAYFALQIQSLQPSA